MREKQKETIWKPRHLITPGVIIEMNTNMGTQQMKPGETLAAKKQTLNCNQEYPHTFICRDLDPWDLFWLM